MPHILALLNLDLGEHTSFEEVEKIRDRVAQELSSWQPDPRVYAFSALKLLLDRRQARGEALDPREAAVLKMWALVPDSAAFSDAEAARFDQDLKAALADLRTRRLAGGSLAQVQMVARGLKEQLELTQDLLSPGAGRHQGVGNPPGGPASAPQGHHGHLKPDHGGRRPTA